MNYQPMVTQQELDTALLALRETQATLDHVRAEGAAALDQAARDMEQGRAMLEEETARADAAERKVCEMSEALRNAEEDLDDVPGRGELESLALVRAALADTTDIAERWVSRNVHEKAKATWLRRYQDVVSECSAALIRVHAVESELAQVGIQLAAARERLALHATVLDPMGQYIRMVKADSDHGAALAVLARCLTAFAALAAVPGDVKAPPRADMPLARTVDYREALGVDVERVSKLKDGE